MSISPFACHFGITYKCNLLCDHCYADKYKNTADFTYEELCNIVDQLYDIGIIQIIYSHGENIMHKDFWRITKYMRDRGFYVTLMTNGTFIRNLDISQKLYNTGVRQVFVSFDSMDPEKHDQRRRVPGSFRRAENALKYFSQVEGIRYGMA
ncbi:MAG: radical SAM protein [Thermoactinomyces sp.]